MEIVQDKPSVNIYPQSNQIVQDAYDTIVADLNIGCKDSKIKSISVVACSPKAGATTVSVNLALSMAMAGWKVIFVDADMRKPRSFKRLDMRTSDGLSDHFAGRQTLKNIICETNIGNLHYISCGNIRNINPIGMFCSPYLSDMLDRLSETYDFTVFDTPCLNTVSDALVLASRTDYVLLVAQAGKSRLSDLRQSLSKLTGAGISDVSIVLNMAKKDAYKKHANAYDYFTKNCGKAKRLGKNG